MSTLYHDDNLSRVNRKLDLACPIFVKCYIREETKYPIEIIFQNWKHNCTVQTRCGGYWVTFATKQVSCESTFRRGNINIDSIILVFIDCCHSCKLSFLSQDILHRNFSSKHFIYLPNINHFKFCNLISSKYGTRTYSYMKNYVTFSEAPINLAEI